MRLLYHKVRYLLILSLTKGDSYAILRFIDLSLPSPPAIGALTRSFQMARTNSAGFPIPRKGAITGTLLSLS